MKRIFILISIIALAAGCSLMPVTKGHLNQQLETFATKIYVQNKIDSLQAKIEQNGYITGDEVLQLIEQSGKTSEFPTDLLKLLEETGTNKIRAFITTHGGGTGALDKIGCASLATNDLGLVFRVSDATMLFYYYDSTATDPEELTNYTIIEPDDVDANCSGNGNWILFDSFMFSGTSTPTLNFKDSDQAHQTIASIAANATDANDSTVTFGVEEDTSITTYITLDGVNEQVTFAKLIAPSAGIADVAPDIATPSSWTLSGVGLHGQLHIASGSSTASLPAVASDYNIAAQTESTNVATIDPNGSETIYLDGTACTAGYTIVSSGTAGDYVFLKYRSAGAWTAISKGFSCGS